MFKKVIIIFAFSTIHFSSSVSGQSAMLKGKIIRALCIDPGNSNSFYAGLKGSKMGTGLVFNSKNPSTNWEILHDKKPISPHTSDIQTIAVSPVDPAIIWAGTWKNGLYKSSDAGLSWGRVSQFPVSDIRSLKFGNNNAQLIYAATSSHGIIKSTDGGASWELSKPAVIDDSFKFAWSIEVSPVNDKVIYAMTFSKGVYKSIDSGENWRKVLDLDGMVAWDLKIADDGQKLWLASSKSGADESKVFTSDDGGETWNSLIDVPQIGANQVNVLSIGGANIIFLGSWNDGAYVYESSKWQKIEAIDFETISEILINDQLIIFGSWGNGIYTIKNKWQ